MAMNREAAIGKARQGSAPSFADAQRQPVGPASAQQHAEKPEGDRDHGHGGPAIHGNLVNDFQIARQPRHQKDPAHIGRALAHAVQPHAAVANKCTQRSAADNFRRSVGWRTSLVDQLLFRRVAPGMFAGRIAKRQPEQQRHGQAQQAEGEHGRTPAGDIQLFKGAGISGLEQQSLQLLPLLWFQRVGVLADLLQPAPRFSGQS
jgi:hypothetical protein